MARSLHPVEAVGHENSRRCALWVSPRVFVAAEELAWSIGLDVDTFISCTVLALREKEGGETRPAAAEKSSMGQVISMADRSRQPAATPVRMNEPPLTLGEQAELIVLVGAHTPRHEHMSCCDRSC